MLISSDRTLKIRARGFYALVFFVCKYKVIVGVTLPYHRHNISMNLSPFFNEAITNDAVLPFLLYANLCFFLFWFFFLSFKSQIVKRAARHYSRESQLLFNFDHSFWFWFMLIESCYDQKTNTHSYHFSLGGDWLYIFCMWSENKMRWKHCGRMKFRNPWTRLVGMEKPSMALLVIAGPTVSRNCNMSLDPLRCISDGDGNSTMLYLPMFSFSH